MEGPVGSSSPNPIDVAANLVINQATMKEAAAKAEELGLLEKGAFTEGEEVTSADEMVSISKLSEKNPALAKLLVDVNKIHPLLGLSSNEIGNNDETRGQLLESILLSMSQKKG